jgi:hypothetical protein
MVLVASCLGDGDTGGGLFSFDGHQIERIDRLSCTGLWTGEGRFARLLHTTAATDDLIELLVYDKRGVVSYARLDDATDPHDLLWDGRAFIVVSTATNSLLWTTPDGSVVRRWKADGDRDAWHLLTKTALPADENTSLNQRQLLDIRDSPEIALFYCCMRRDHICMSLRTRAPSGMSAAAGA